MIFPLVWLWPRMYDHPHLSDLWSLETIGICDSIHV